MNWVTSTTLGREEVFILVSTILRLINDSIAYMVRTPRLMTYIVSLWIIELVL